MLETISSYYSTISDSLGYFVSLALGYVTVIGLIIYMPYLIVRLFQIRRRGLKMQAKIVEQISDGNSGRRENWTPVYELIADTANIKTLPHAEKRVKGMVESGLTSRKVGAIVSVHFDPETEAVISTKDQIMSLLLYGGLFVMAVLVAVLYLSDF